MADDDGNENCDQASATRDARPGGRRRVAKATGKMPLDESDERTCMLALMASVCDDDDDDECDRTKVH